MTNSEAIKQLKFLKKVDFHIDTKESCEIAISALEENTKLKAKIEELKEEVLANENWSDVVERTLKKEIDKNEMLKSELEQLVKQYGNVESLYHKYYNLYKKSEVSE